MLGALATSPEFRLLPLPPSPTNAAAADAQPAALSERLIALFPPGQVVRYLITGVFNTIFGYGAYAAILYLLGRVAPPRFLYLTVIAASILSTPLNITVSYLNYKFFVFRTRGNYLREWLKAFGVYGVSMIPGLLLLSALTKLLQVFLHGHAPFGKNTAGYLAGAIITGCSTIVSFVGHKKVTFRERSTEPPPAG